MRVASTIERIAAGGAGVGRLPDGRTVFVHRTAPDEDVELRVTQEKRRWARGALLAVRRASPDRRDAPCPFYARCGGCTLEHLVYPAQLRAKARIVADALARIGGLDLAEPIIVASPAEFRYRNRVSFTLLRLGADRVVAGFHELERPDRVLDLTGACLLPEAGVAAAWDALRENWGAGASRLPSGDRLRVTVRATAEGRAAVLVQGGHGPGRPDELLERVPRIAALWHQPAAARRPVLLGGHEDLAESWADEDVAVTGAVFLQVNRAAAALLEEYVLHVAGPAAGVRIIDAYCGLGLHARRFARAGARVIGIELDREAVRLARRSSAEEAGSLEFVEGDVGALLPGVLPADLVLVNPPRVGMDGAVTAALTRAPPRRLLYVSCDPATLARDLKRLAGAFRVHSVRCFDLFPQTAHVETVVELACATS